MRGLAGTTRRVSTRTIGVPHLRAGQRGNLMTRILSWNIMHGGGSRLPGILDAIEDHAPDIVTLQEVRRGKAEPVLREGLEAMGFAHIHLPETAEARENTILIAAREPFEAQRWPDANGQCHDLCAEFDGLTLHALHFPQKKAQLPLFHALLDLPTDGRALLIGDMNCGIPFEDSDTKTFQNTHLFQRLLAHGWTDLWRDRHPQAREYSWVSAKRGNGFRYDHALATASLDRRVRDVRYDHAVRESKLSDHSALIVDLEDT